MNTSVCDEKCSSKSCDGALSSCRSLTGRVISCLMERRRDVHCHVCPAGVVYVVSVYTGFRVVQLVMCMWS